MPELTACTEAVSIAEALLEKDERLLKDVVLVKAGSSANKRYYSPELLKSAAPLFEGAHAFMDHKPLRPNREAVRLEGSRSIGELTGTYRNVRFDEAAGAIRADRLFARTRAGEDAFAVAVDVLEGRIPKDSIGLSISYMGEQVWDEERNMNAIRQIHRVESVDDVISPAAGGAYIESAEHTDELLEQMGQSLSYEQWAGLNTEHMKRARSEAAQEGTVDIEKRIAELEEEKTKLEQQLTEQQSGSDEALKEARIARLLSTCTLPTAWKKDLEKMLQEAKIDELLPIVEREEAKAASVRGNVKERTKVPVKVGDERIAEQTTAQEGSPAELAPQDNETIREWQQRIQTMNASRLRKVS